MLVNFLMDLYHHILILNNRLYADYIFLLFSNLFLNFMSLLVQSFILLYLIFGIIYRSLNDVYYFLNLMLNFFCYDLLIKNMQMYLYAMVVPIDVLDHHLMIRFLLLIYQNLIRSLMRMDLR